MLLQRYYTVGMAGHIDHGKTTLTKALTGIDTDRLEEEKRRGISIEPGFAPLVQTENIQISLIDVPGHEKFIRQMIAGAAGIDFVVLVIAADEGVMPQTREHLAILTLLGIKQGLVALTKTDLVEADLLALVREDVQDATAGTFLAGKSIHEVDSITGKGVNELKETLTTAVSQLEKKATYAAFRLPIDQVFTVKGLGVIVRGTIFDGEIHVGDTVTLLPTRKTARVRQIESHHEQRTSAFAGQRAAINLTGITRDEIVRGDMMVTSDFYTVTSRINISLTVLPNIKYQLKQRQSIKLNVGTAEVMGRIIFFDRNALDGNESAEILCQLELDEEIAVTRGDRFILRRATPTETIGGGWIIESNAQRERFGKNTMNKLLQQKEGTPKERITALLQEKYALTKEVIKQTLGISETDFSEMNLTEITKDTYALPDVISELEISVINMLENFHDEYPLRPGMNKAEIYSQLKQTIPTILIDYLLKEMGAKRTIRMYDQFVSTDSFKAHYPPAWEKRMEQVVLDWRGQGVDVEKHTEICSRHGIPIELQTELYHFLLNAGVAYQFDEGRLLPVELLQELKEKLEKQTAGKDFTLQNAREALGLSRKNLIPLLELFDSLGYTRRLGEKRIWID